MLRTEQLVTRDISLCNDNLVFRMSARGRSPSPRPLNDGDVDMENGGSLEKAGAKVVIVTNLTRNVVETHLQTIFGFYGQITKIDLPLFGKCELEAINLSNKCSLTVLEFSGSK